MLNLTRRLATATLAERNLRFPKEIPGLLSSKGLQYGWQDRLRIFENKLATDIKDKPQFAKKNILEIVLENGTLASRREIVQDCSMLYNLQFTWSCIRKDWEYDNFAPTALKEKDTKNDNYILDQGCIKLHNAIVDSFDSMKQFKLSFLDSANAIGGDGFTWLVARLHHDNLPFANNNSNYNFSHLWNDGKDIKSSVYNNVFGDSLKFDSLFIVNTYNAGTPYQLNTWEKYNSYKGENKDLETNDRINELNRITETNLKYKDNTIKYVPLLAIDASPKVWLTDFGVTGKELYLNTIWNFINWEIVQSRLPKWYKPETFI